MSNKRLVNIILAFFGLSALLVAFLTYNQDLHLPDPILSTIWVLTTIIVVVNAATQELDQKPDHIIYSGIWRRTKYPYVCYIWGIYQLLFSVSIALCVVYKPSLVQLFCLVPGITLGLIVILFKITIKISGVKPHSYADFLHQPPK